MLLLVIVLVIASVPALAHSAKPKGIPASSGGDFELNWYTVDGGGGASQGGNYSVSGTVGQPDASSSVSDEAYSLVGGYWGVSFIQKMKEIFLPLITR